jgi:uncharacterized protein (TIGR03084 family)
MVIPSAVPSDGVKEEGAVLAELLRDRDRTDLLRGTPFQGWRVVDEVVHLLFLDHIARLTLTDRSRYEKELAAYRTATDAATAETTFAVMAAYEGQWVGTSEPLEIVARWRAGLAELVDLLADRAPDAAVDWFGRSMRLSRLAAARQMELWCYGQDIFDTFQLAHPTTDHLWAVADFGVRTRRFSFQNRGLAVPEPAPVVRLESPSGSTWEWPSGASAESADLVEGSAQQFCLVVTQRRHLDDTDLQVRGAGAAAWLPIAQTIAGLPRSGPPAGQRSWERSTR